MNLKNNKAFTLIEVLLSLAATGILMTSASMYLYSITNIWLNDDDNQYFNDHVDGVTLFLNQLLSHSEGKSQNNQIPISWKRPPGFSEFDEPLLSFQLKDTPALMVWKELALPGLTCYLYFEEEEGLKILWHSRLQEIEEVDQIFQTVVSSFVESIRFGYYDSDDDNWEITDQPDEDRNGNFILPDNIILKFSKDDEVRETSLYVPPKNQDVPIY